MVYYANEFRNYLDKDLAGSTWQFLYLRECALRAISPRFHVPEILTDSGFYSMNLPGLYG